MVEEIAIGKLIIDNSELNAAIVSSKKVIVDLEAEQKKLKKDTNNLTEANEEQLKTFVAKEQALKGLKAEYNVNQKSVVALTKAQLGLDASLALEIKTQDQAIANTKELIAARRQLDTTTEEGARAIAEINAKIDANNRLNNESNSQLEQQKVNIGNYADEFKNASDNLNPLNGGLQGFVARSKEAGGAGKLVGNSLIGMSKGFVGVAKAGLAFIATPVGAVVLALVVVFTAIKNAMNRSEEATAKITKVFAILSGAVNALMDVLVPLGEYFIDEYVKQLETVTKAMDSLFASLAAGLKYFGFDDAAKSVENFTAKVKEGVSTSQELVQAQADLDKANRKAGLTQQQYEFTAERLRQLRDDETKSVPERMALSAQLADTLKKQAKEELALANQALRVADLTIEAEGRRKEHLDARAAALLKIGEINNRILGQESEQLASLNSLRKEAAAKIKAINDKAEADRVKNAKNQIEILKLEAAASDLTTEQLLANAQKVYDLETKLLNSTTSGSDQTKAALQAKQNLSSSILAITQKQIAEEIEMQAAATEAQKADTLEVYNAQKQSAEDLANAQILLLDKKLLSEKDYADGVIAITTAKNEALTEIQTNFDEAEALRQETAAANTAALEAVEFELRIQNIIDRDATEQEIRQELALANYDRELEELSTSLANKEITEAVYLKKKELADKKYNSGVIKNEKILAQQKKALGQQMLADGIGALQSLFGESKALSVAAALINTYQGITAGVKLGYPAAIPAVIAAATTGFAAVKNILSTSKDSTGGATTSTAASVSTSGTGSFTNTSESETIARVSEKPTEQNTVVTPPVLVLETLAEVQNNVAIKVASN